MNINHIAADATHDALTGLHYTYDHPTATIAFANPADGDEIGILHLQPGAQDNEVRFTIACTHAGTAGYRRGTDEELTDQFTDMLMTFFAAPAA